MKVFYRFTDLVVGASHVLERRVASALISLQLLLRQRLQLFVQEKAGQGTTEYAILVGVIVVIAIVAIIAFRGKIQELWSAIADGINSL